MAESSKNQIFNLEKLTQFRQTMHTYPELGFKEFITQKAIKKFLQNECGNLIEDQQIKVCAQTGFTVDIYGKAPAEQNKKNFLIALRADIDALSMTEQNPDLPYKSQTNAAHACGHDGHTTSLLGFTQLFLQNIDSIPANKGVRLLFQPSEEGPISGAKAMIEDGCLEGVDECYGYHNWPLFPVGKLLVKSGIFMAAVYIIKLHFYGKGGHGSAPQDAIDPVQMAVDFHIKFKEMQETIFKDNKYVCTIPVLQGGERYNVIANSSYLEGTMRNLETEEGFGERFKQSFIQVLEEVKQLYPGSDYKLNFDEVYPATVNHEKETQEVIKAGNSFFQPENVGDFDVLPVKASEDFSFFIQKVPGCYFFLGSGRDYNDIMLHDCHYNYNDKLIEPSAQFFLKLVESRFSQV